MSEEDHSGLFWVDGPWSGRLALALRPRGADWLAADVALWRNAGLQAVVSFVTPAEEMDLQLGREGELVRELGLKFFACPIEDRSVPESRELFESTVQAMVAVLANGENVAVHCRQNVGRSGVFAACVLHRFGVPVEDALVMLSAARGVRVPETEEQRQWLLAYAAK